VPVTAAHLRQVAAVVLGVPERAGPRFGGLAGRSATSQASAFRPDLVGAAEVVDHLGDRAAGTRVPLVVRQLQIPRTTLPSLLTRRVSRSYTPTSQAIAAAQRERHAGYRVLCYGNWRSAQAYRPMTRADALDQALVCL